MIRNEDAVALLATQMNGSNAGVNASRVFVVPPDTLAPLSPRPAAPNGGGAVAVGGGAAASGAPVLAPANVRFIVAFTALEAAQRLAAVTALLAEWLEG